MRKVFAVLLTIMMMINLMPQNVLAGATYTPDDGHEHQYSTEWWYHPTCTEPGKAEYFCNLCGYTTEPQEVPALGHLWGGDSEYQEPKCLTDGSAHHSCTREFDDGTQCGYSETYVIPALGHHIVTVPDTWPTCLNPGSGHEYCDRVYGDGTKCDYTSNFNTPDLGGHDWGEWVRVKEPTTTEEGKEVRYCNRGDATEERPVPKLTGGQESSSESSTPAESSTPTDTPTPPTTTPTTPPGKPKPQNTNPLLVLSFALNESPAGKGVGDYLQVMYNMDNKGNAPLTVTAYPASAQISADDIATMGPSYSWIEPGNGCFLEVLYKLTQDDIDKGYLERTISVIYKEWDTTDPNNVPAYPQEYETNKVTIHIDLEDIYGDESFAKLAFTKTLLTPIPACGFFVQGDTVLFELSITNFSECEVSSIRLYDPLVFGTAPVAIIYALQAASTGMNSYSITVPYTITEQDALNGIVLNEAYAAIPGWGVLTASETAPCGIWGEEWDGMTLTKKVINEPASGYFKVNDTIQYTLTLENPSDHTYYNVVVYDLYSTGPIGTFPQVSPGQTYEMTFDYPVQPYHMGTMINNYGYVFVGADLHTYSNTVTSKVEDPVEPLPTIIKEVISTPANGVYYTEGEMVEYLFTVTNTANKDLAVYSVWDLKNNPAMSPQGINLTVGDTATYSFMYEVTEQDCINGTIENTGVLFYKYDAEDPDATVPSNAVIVPTGFVDTGYVNVYKMVNSVPGNGMFFVEGDTIEFLVAVTNGTPYAVTNVCVYDSIFMKAPEYIAKMESLDTVVYTFDYTVTEMDCIMGKVYNVATANYIDPNLGMVVVSSNEVSADCGIFGMEWEDSFLNALDVVKTETSTPANGKYYKEGEMITYSITVTNTGDIDLTDVITYDSKATLYGGEIGYAETLHVGESRTYTFSWVVTASDVKRGYVMNNAMSTGFDPSGVVVTGYSNDVYSPTSEKAPEGGYDFDVEKIIGLNEGDGYDSCKRTMVPANEHDIGYILENCSIHAAIDEALMKALEKADDAEDKELKAYEDAIAAWKDALDDLYKELLERVSHGTTRMLIMSDRTLYLDQLNSFERSLKLTMSEVDAAEIIARELKNQVTELCYLNATAPDSLPEDKEVLMMEHDEELCEIEDENEETRKAGYEELVYTFCAMHQGGATSIRDLLAGINRVGNSMKTWEAIRAFWQTSLFGLMDARFEEATGESREAVRTENINFYTYMEAHEKLLQLVYETEEDIQETIVRSLMDRTMLVCEATDITEKVVKDTTTGHSTARSDRGEDVKPEDLGKLEEQKAQNESSTREEHQLPTVPVKEKGKGNTVLYVGIGAGVVLAGAAAALLIVFKRKKK